MSLSHHAGQGPLEARRAFQQLRNPIHSDGFDRIDWSAGALGLGQVAYLTTAETLAVLGDTGTFQGDRMFGVIARVETARACLYVSGKQIVLVDGSSSSYKKGDRLYLGSTPGSATRNHPATILTHVYQIGGFTSWFSEDDLQAWAVLQPFPVRSGA